MNTAILVNILFFLVFALVGYHQKFNKIKCIVFIVLFILATANVAHYLHFFDNFVYYFEYRAFWWADFTPCLSGFLVGFTFHLSNKIYRTSMLALLILISFYAIMGPWAKLFLWPINYETLENRWQGNIALQSTGTCGPCSLANILKNYGVDTTENELAEEAYTSLSGTEIWYLARCAKRRGFQTKFVYDINRIEKNSILGTSLGNIGHFISILDIKNDKLYIADSLHGLKAIEKKDLHLDYTFKGMSLIITKK